MEDGGSHTLRHLFTAVLLLLGGAAAARAQKGAEIRAEIRTSFLMDHDPEIHVPPTVNVVEPAAKLKALWLEALARPEADMQRMAANAITRGHAAGLAGLDDAVPRLETVLTSAASHPAARLAVARALVELGAKASAASMAASAQQFGADLRQVIEPALAQWDYRPMREMWQARLNVPQVHHRELVLAIRCLTTAGDESAVGALLELVHNAERSPDVRIEAARSAGILVNQGLEADARALTAGGKAASKLNRLCGMQLVARHAGDDALALLRVFAVDAEPAIAAIALGRLIEIDPQLVLPLVARAIGSADAKIRRHGAHVYLLLPDPDRVAVLAGLLNDPHPGLRSSVCEWLHELSRVPELGEPILRSATEVLAKDDWRGLEQAALLLAAMDHKPAAPRLVELLDYRRTEVRVAAAWGAKMLAVPETLPALLTAALRRTEMRMGKDPQPPDLDVQTAHLLELFGKTKYRDAEPLLRRHVPKEFKMGLYSRAAAIWSLGFLHEGVPDDDLARQLFERLTDNGPPFPEMLPTKEMSAVTIGRMKAVSQAPVLRKLIVPNITAGGLSLRIRWAVMELTGESIPEPSPPTAGKSGWFLEPIIE